MANPLFTLGHSNRTLEEILQILRDNSITAIGDVRSSPYSRYTPQFNREPLSNYLKSNGIDYVFLGKELGGRPEDPNCYQDGKVQYQEVANTKLFHQGIERLKNGLQSHRIGIMCAERDPLTCHRMILVTRFLRESWDIHHILDSQNVETNHTAEKRLLRLLGISETNLFMGFDELIADAYVTQSDRIAYQMESKNLAEEHGAKR